MSSTVGMGSSPGTPPLNLILQRRVFKFQRMVCEKSVCTEKEHFVENKTEIMQHVAIFPVPYIQWNLDLSFLKEVEKTNDKCGEMINPEKPLFLNKK
jgi:hypothetical protein